MERTVEGLSGRLKVTLERLRRQLKEITARLTAYDEPIEVLAHTPRYEKAVHALICYKGVKTFFALTIVTEVGDIKRFPHPR